MIKNLARLTCATSLVLISFQAHSADLDVYDPGAKGGGLETFEQGRYEDPIGKLNRDFKRENRPDGFLRGICDRRRAVNKAHRLGMHYPRVIKITDHEIVVAGSNKGYRAGVVFSRYGYRCKIIDMVGI